MRKIVLTYGLISGAILSLFLTVGMFFFSESFMDIDKGELIGYSTMIVALSLIFFGVKSYRDHYLNGTISLWKGIQVGLLITAIASVMYAASWEVYAQARPDAMADFMEQYQQHLLDEARAEGATQAQIEEQIEEMKSFSEMYKNPIVRFGITLVEILPVGLLITLISAAVLRRKELLPAGPSIAG